MTRNLAPAVAAAVKAAGVKRRTVDHADRLMGLIEALIIAREPLMIVPEREVPFATQADRRFRFDIAWRDQMLAVEIHGGTFSGGGHTRGAHFESDCEKMRYATLLGWRVLAFTARELNDDPWMVLEVIRAAYWRSPPEGAMERMRVYSSTERARSAKRKRERSKA